MATVKVNGAEFYYELHGQGQPLVLVNGYNTDTTMWTPVVGELAKSYQVLIFDNRGMGKTIDDGLVHLTVELMADDAIGIIRALGLTKPYVLGLSMGGSIVQYMGKKYGNEISKLVLLCTSSKWRKAALQGMELFIKLREQNINAKTIVEGAVAWCFGEKFLENTQMMKLVIEAMANNPNQPSITNQKRQFAALTNFDGREIVKSINIPTLVIAGTEDLLSLPSDSEYLVNNITNAKLVQLNCAHLPTFEVTNEFTKVLNEFLG